MSRLSHDVIVSNLDASDVPRLLCHGSLIPHKCQIWMPVTCQDHGVTSPQFSIDQTIRMRDVHRCTIPRVHVSEQENAVFFFSQLFMFSESERIVNS